MKQDDIEKILQQYGADRRQQQQLSDSLHGMARRQRQRVLWSCTVVLVAVFVWTLHLLTPLQKTEEFVVAQQDIHTQAQVLKPTPLQQNTPEFSLDNTKRPATTPTTSQPLTESPQQENNISSEYAASEPSTLPMELPSGNTETPQTDDPTPQEPTSPVVNPYDNHTILLADNTAITPSEDESSHLRLKASVGASTFSRIGKGNVDDPGLSNNPYSNNGEPSILVTPNATLAANIGVSYSIPMGGQRGLELGVGLSGYTHQSEATRYSTESVSFIDGTTTDIQTSYSDPFYMFGLYANLPLTFNFKSKSMKDIGWNLSVTPSHSLVSSKSMGALAADRPVLNPWRLTMGVGLTFPRGLFRYVNLTANLLSLYTSSSYHEIGIELGF
ncbi:MAG: hypothetical protein K6D59_01890 [Bacteroidales bacterium]|nr:hypothetical protein [Bacteroidales bacterium]